MRKYCPKCHKYFDGTRQEAYCPNCLTEIYLERIKKQKEKIVLLKNEVM